MGEDVVYGMRWERWDGNAKTDECSGGCDGLFLCWVSQNFWYYWGDRFQMTIPCAWLRRCLRKHGIDGLSFKQMEDTDLHYRLLLLSEEIVTCLFPFTAMNFSLNHVC